MPHDVGLHCLPMTLFGLPGRNGLTILLPKIIKFAISIDPDEVVHHEPPYLALYSLNLQYDTVNPLYNSTHYNSKILYKVILICTEWLFCSKFVFITAYSVQHQNVLEHIPSS